VEELARELAAAGAAALSVLTDEEFFQGRWRIAVRVGGGRNCRVCARILWWMSFSCWRRGRIPRCGAAHCGGIIADGIDRACARRPLPWAGCFCAKWHDEEELQRALDAGCDLIGVNTRDLRTFKVDVENGIPPGGPASQERGCGWRRVGFTRERILRGLRAVGYQAFLIGESLMRAEAPGEALRALVANAELRVPSGR